jgi:thiol:disulfide interchange protein DsbG
MRVGARLAAAVALMLAFVPARVPAAVGLGPLYAELERTHYVAEGARMPKSVLYVFFDANCYYCKLTWKALQPYEKAGLQVRWIPVAYQQESSAGMAAAILDAPSPAQALRENETRYSAKSYDGGIKPLARVAPSIRRALDAHMDLMRRFGAQGTPAIVWKDAQGKLGFRNAVPRLSELPAITGLPAQRNDDPELKEFR